MTERTTHKVLVVTGGFLNEKETSLLRAARKQMLQWRAAKSAWLDLKIKLVMAEPMLAGQLERTRMQWRAWRPGSGAGTGIAVKQDPGSNQGSGSNQGGSGSNQDNQGSATSEAGIVRAYFAANGAMATPELTEVVLTTQLAAEGMAYATASVDQVFGQSARMQAMLQECDCVFLSATLLRDLSEVEPLLALLKRPHNRIVLGGALANLLADDWQGAPEVDILAVGYGEMLVPKLVQYIRAGFRDLQAPPTGRIEQRGSLQILRSGAPNEGENGRSLDFLLAPDWAQAERDAGRRFNMIYYESVRGCPYRCNFCNYPYLFDDTRFRYKSAQKIADDWQRYTETTGAEYLTCLDSLFTMPRSRLTALCNELVKRQIKIKWICYARADDLAKLEIAQMMLEAGAHQVQIGIESGHQQQLDNMDKQCTVEANAQALENCRRIGLTSVISLIVGFPGETAETLEATYRFLQATPPDFYFLATFSTRVANVPVLNAANRARFALSTDQNPHTVAPYWQHASMSSGEVGNHVRALNLRLMQNRVALNAPMFYSGMLGFAAAQREALLAFQARAAGEHPWLTRGMDMANRWLDKHLQRDMARHQHEWQRAERAFPAATMAATMAASGIVGADRVLLAGEVARPQTGEGKRIIPVTLRHDK